MSHAHSSGTDKRHAKPSGYTLAMRWQAPADPTWEIETMHDGFASAEDAALFAYGLTSPGAESLDLVSGVLTLALTNGLRRRFYDQDVSVYRLTNNVDPAQAEDADFSRVEIMLDALSRRLRLDGEFVFLTMRVIGPAAQPVAVAIELRQGGRLQVAVNERADTREQATATRSVRVSAIPRASRS